MKTLHQQSQSSEESDGEKDEMENQDAAKTGVKGAMKTCDEDLR